MAAAPGTLIIYYTALLNTLRTFFEIKERMVTLEIIHVFIEMFFSGPSNPDDAFPVQYNWVRS